ncbi:hypothetical protein [Desulfohalovibrio reitneri]|uniref:hypothetical protein n=1 Tax=Desulfohalovibrio reitneri TaxID=1307759 RepID=UPI000B0EBA3B|nr:hypothetical protein [Desulfohalovibrio reitneri]
MPNCLLNLFSRVFDYLHGLWESRGMQKRVGALLVLTFLVGLAGIQLKIWGMLPHSLARLTPSSHYYAIDLAFTLVLAVEVLGLVFALPSSFSRSVGKQLEILALILLRGAFKQLKYFPEPIDLTRDLEPLLTILAEASGALAIFVVLGFYYRQRHFRTIRDDSAVERFVAFKKGLSLVLLAGFAGSAAYDGYLLFMSYEPYGFFKTFYTVLIFSDILIVLASQLDAPWFHAVFRNSGLAVSTLIMRLALTAPPLLAPLLGLAAALLALGLTMAFNRFAYSFLRAEYPPMPEPGEPGEPVEKI